MELEELDAFFVELYSDDPDVTFVDEPECKGCDAQHGVNEPHEMEVDDN